MAINKIEIQNSTGDIYYPHTSSDVVKYGVNSTVQKIIEEILTKYVTFDYTGDSKKEYPLISANGK